VTEPVVIHATSAELATELFWTLHIDPVAREYGLKPPMTLHRADLDSHLFEHPDDGRVLLIVITDREGA
jgi:hypothetical protein